MVLNQQKAERINLAGLRSFERMLRAALGLGDREFNICCVDDARIAQLNAAHRGKPLPTDVLSFPWEQRAGPASVAPEGEFAGFLGDVVISVETARRNAAAEGHGTEAEIRLLIVHGLLHLLGMDHETDRGEMTALELGLRGRLGLAGGSPARTKPALATAGKRGGARGAGRRR